MRIVLVGTDLAPVRTGAGALETLVAGWAEALAADDDVHVLSVPEAAPGRRRPPAPPDGPDGGGVGPVEVHHFQAAADIRVLVDKLAPDAVVLNNRPAWQVWVTAPTLHLLHNWPDAWELPAGVTEARSLIGDATAAAVSGALAATAASILGRDVGQVATVSPFVGEEFFAATRRPEADVVLAPNRLMVKKGVRELVAASRQPTVSDRRFLITNYLSPWTRPTAEHLALQALVRAAPACVLVEPPDSREALADLYGRASVVVCPSIRPEGLGLTAVEAQAAGVPVVSSGLGGLREATLLPALVADPSDPVALAAAIEQAAHVDAAALAGLRREVRARFSRASSVASLRAAVGNARPAATKGDR